MSSTQLSSEEPSLLEQVLNTSARCFEAITKHQELTIENLVSYGELLSLLNPAQDMLVNIFPNDSAEENERECLEKARDGTAEIHAIRMRASAQSAKLKAVGLKLGIIYEDMIENIPDSCSSIEVQRAWIQPVLDIVNGQMCYRIPDEDGCESIPMQCIIAAMKLGAHMLRLEPSSLVMDVSQGGSYLFQIEMLLALAIDSLKFQHMDDYGNKYLATLHVYMNTARIAMMTNHNRSRSPITVQSQAIQSAFNTSYEAMLKLEKLIGILV